MTVHICSQICESLMKLYCNNVDIGFISAHIPSLAAVAGGWLDMPIYPQSYLISLHHEDKQEVRWRLSSSFNTTLTVHPPAPSQTETQPLYPPLTSLCLK